MLAMSGCMGALTNEGTDQLTITPAQYRDAFDAAARTAQQMGYKVVVVDRSNGIIETEPRHAGGALEPWRFDNDGFEEATQIQLQVVEDGFDLNSFQLARISMQFRQILFCMVPRFPAALERKTDSMCKHAPDQSTWMCGSI